MDEIVKKEICAKSGWGKNNEKKTEIEKTYINKQFLKHLYNLAETFSCTFGKLFKNNKIRIIIRYNNKAEPVSYVPFIEYPPKNNPSSREYPWILPTGEKSITNVAFETQEPRIYSLNSDLVGFNPYHWEDFIVIAPDDPKFKIESPGEKTIEYPAISFTFSVRVKEEIKIFAEKIDAFKEMKKKIYLLPYVQVEGAITTAINNFLHLFAALNAEDFIAFLQTMPAYSNWHNHKENDDLNTT